MRLSPKVVLHTSADNNLSIRVKKAVEKIMGMEFTGILTAKSIKAIGKME